MGRSKDGGMERENKIHIAIGLCEEVGAIEECDAHEGTYLDTMEWSDPEELTDEILKHDTTAIEHFDSREEMIDCVRDALTHAGEECPSCEKNRNS
ncbi:hypothetical protein EGT07_23825 [Herbaspirillum sp. HC18]|nr:hypothetical protein EGT07_23825 [Herbaspirillum sp. HC18]